MQPNKTQETIDTSRRQFLEKAGKAATVAPAAGLLLAASQQAKAQAASDPYAPPPEISPNFL